MTTIKLSANDQVLSIVTQPKIASGDINSVLLQVDFDDGWDGYIRTAVFYTSLDETVYKADLTDDQCIVPYEVLAEPGTLFIGVRGVKSDNTVKTTILVKYKIELGAPSGVKEPGDIPPGGGGGGVKIDSEIFNGGDTIVPKTSLTLTAFGDNTRTYIHSDVEIKVGETYIVNWEGTKYTCIGQKINNNLLLGDGSVWGLSATGEPFTIRYFNPVTNTPDNLEIVSRYMTEDILALATATIEITTLQTVNPKYIPDMYYEENGVVHKIDKKFLPDDIGGGGGDPGGTIDPTRIPDMYYTEERQDVEILPTSTAIDTGSSIMGELYVVGNPITLVEGKTYKVTYNGVEYECVAIAGEVQGESSILLGDVAVLETGTPSGAYPFVIATNDYMVSLGACAAVIPLNGSTSVTVSIVGYGEEIHHLPSKYIKDMYYEEETELLSETALTFTNVDGMMMATIENPSFALEAGKTYVVIYNGTEYICECDPEHLVLGNIGALMGTPTDEPFVIGTMDGTFGAISVYGETNATLSIKTNVVNKIKNKYIDFSEVVPVIDLTALGLPYVSPDDMGGGQTPTLDLETCNYIRSAMRKGALIFKYNEGYSEPYKKKSVLVTDIVIDHTGHYSASTCAPTNFGDIVDISFGIYGSGTSSITVTYRNHPVGNLKKDYILLYSKKSKGYYIKVTDDGELYATDNALE